MITKNSSGTNLSANYDSVVAVSPREWQVQLYVNSTPLSCGIKKIDITKGSCGSTESFSIGNVYSSMMTAELLDLSTDIKGEDIEVRIGLNTGSMEWITIGWFTAIEVVKTAYSTSVTAYGFSSSKMAGTFTIPSTLSLVNIANAIQTATGLTVSFGNGITTGYVLAGTIDEGISCFQGLQILAHAVGGYATDTYDGNIVVNKFSNTSTLSVTTDRMKTLPNVEEQNFSITGVQVTATGQYQYTLTTDTAIDPNKTYYTYNSSTGQYDEVEEPDVSQISTYYERSDIVYTYGTPISLFDENPNMSANVFDIYKGIVGYSFKTGNIDLSVGDPRIEGNDVLSVTDVNGNVYTVPCHMITHHYDGGLSTTVQAVKATSGDDGLVSKAPITQQIDQIGQATAIAKASAQQAERSAQQAQQSASIAESKAQEAIGMVDDIRDLAQSASDNAEIAQQSALSATSSANVALDHLGIVENVVGVLDMLQTHGDYRVTSDTTVIPNKWYFTRSGESPNYIYEVVNSPASIEYAPTTDTEVDSGKTYYSRSGTGAGDDPYVYTVVEPVGTEDPSSEGWYECIFYELTGIDTTIQNYISNQLVVDDQGLWLKRPLSTGIKTKVLLSAEDGVVLYDENGHQVGQYGSTAVIGDPHGMHIQMTGGNEARLSFYNNETEVAYIDGQKLYITQTIVLEQMDLGETIPKGNGQWSWMVHPNDENPPRNNLNLKWVG